MAKLKLAPQGFDTIIIISSLKEQDKKTGVKLKEYLDLLNTTRNLGLEIYIYFVKTEIELENNFALIEKSIEESHKIPLIHFETHGSNDESGLVLSNNDYIGWKKLGDFCRKINIKTKNSLFVSVSACFGGKLAECINIKKECPFSILIGPTTMIYPNDIENFNEAFFMQLFESKKLNCSFFEGLHSIERCNVKCTYINPEQIFYEAVKISFNLIKDNKRIKEKSNYIKQSFQIKGNRATRRKKIN